ncbi:MAG: NapC/NirT family cytochrome c [Halioglobus sp.]
MKIVWGSLLAGAALAALAFAGFEATMHYTSTDEFCGAACHEMSVPAASLAGTAHGFNAHGVSVGCADCHIPKEFVPKMVRKVEASREVWGHVSGLIDTPEKYAAHRPAMQQRELARIRANDSQECRNCHDVQNMDFDAQERAVRRYHRGMSQRGKTCIDCHQGLAHPDA